MNSPPGGVVTSGAGRVGSPGLQLVDDACLDVDHLGLHRLGIEGVRLETACARAGRSRWHAGAARAHAPDAAAQRALDGRGGVGQAARAREALHVEHQISKAVLHGGSFTATANATT